MPATGARCLDEDARVRLVHDPLGPGRVGAFSVEAGVWVFGSPAGSHGPVRARLGLEDLEVEHRSRARRVLTSRDDLPNVRARPGLLVYLSIRVFL